MTTIEDFREYAKIEHDEDEAMVELSFEAAMQHAKDVGVTEELLNSQDKKVCLYICALAKNIYDERGCFVPDPWTQGQLNKMRRELVMRGKLQTKSGETE